MPQDIHYSDGSTVPAAVPVIWKDYSVEARGTWYRAYWVNGPHGTSGCPVIGYCSPGGSHQSVKAVAAEVLKYYPGETVYFNGSPVAI